MKKNYLSDKGLSMSQAQTVSNLCNQNVLEIQREIAQINNASRKISYNGEIFVQISAKPIPENIIERIVEIGKFTSCQGFLMENIKAKEEILTELKNKKFTSEDKEPIRPQLTAPKIIPHVEENWGWEQLSKKEIADFIVAESYSAHIGTFIHNNGKLNQLRKELPTLQELEFFKVNEQTIPVKIIIHHKSEQLFQLHEDLAKLHSEYEQKCNYFKAKVKNLVTQKNAEIAKENSDAAQESTKINNELVIEYNTKLETFLGKIKIDIQNFEEKRQKDIQKAASLRIEIPEIFKDTVNKFNTIEK